MQLGSAWFTPVDECIYCGQLGHFLATFLLWPKKGGLLVSQTTSSSVSLLHMQIQATLCLNQHSLPLLALVNSGTDDSFLDAKLASQTGIPITVHALDGRCLAHITHATPPSI